MTGERDELDNELSTVVYEGPCYYQKGGQTSLSIVTRNDVVYLPANNVLIEANDVVEAVSTKDRKMRGVVKTVRDISLRLQREKFTKLELKQATGQ
jgi:hypothetical protein